MSSPRRIETSVNYSSKLDSSLSLSLKQKIQKNYVESNKLMSSKGHSSDRQNQIQMKLDTSVGRLLDINFSDDYLKNHSNLKQISTERM